LKFLIKYYEKTKNYNELKKHHSDLSNLYEQLSIAVNKTNRLFGSYYKITFYGKMFTNDLNGIDYIYKLPKITRLSELISIITKNIVEQYGKDILKIVQNNDDLNSLMNQNDFAYVQIISLIVVNQNSVNNSYFDQFTNFNTFIYETPFTKEGKNQAKSLEFQYKRKTILKTETSFPCMVTRLKIINESDEIITPVENAIEIIQSSIDRIENSIRINPEKIEINNLHMILSGTVIPQVNEGIPQIIRTFLGKDSNDKFDKNLIDILNSKVLELFNLSSIAIDISDKIKSIEHIPLQEKFNEGYQILLNIYQNK
jgi:hypothetical protein